MRVTFCYLFLTVFCTHNFAKLQAALSTLIKDETQTKALEVFLVVKIVRFILKDL